MNHTTNSYNMNYASDLVNSSVHLSATENSYKRVFGDRSRTNVLRGAEQTLILWLVKRVPGSVTPNILTFLGGTGSLMVLAGFVLASYLDVTWLLLGIAGLAINWIGDSLDGRLAYYRNIPRKWYGFALDIIMDWTGTVFIGLGYMVYADGPMKFVAFIFVVLYGWSMIIALLRYKITGYYTIDSGKVGPTELRVLLIGILLLEIVVQGSIAYFAVLLSVILLVVNFLDTRALLTLGDLRDKHRLPSQK